MSHSSEEHHHHHHHVGVESMNKTFLVCIIVNLLFVGIEALVGYYGGSLGLVSDAGHNLSDVLGIGLAMLAFWLEHKRKSVKAQEVSRIISIINALLLIVAVVVIVVEAIHKFTDQTEVNGKAMIITALIAIFVNGLTAWMLMKGEKENVNVRAAFLHAAADALVSVGVVVSGIVIYYTGWVMIDPIISIVISLIILVPSLKLLVECLGHHHHES